MFAVSGDRLAGATLRAGDAAAGAAQQDARHELRPRRRRQPVYQAHRHGQSTPASRLSVYAQFVLVDGTRISTYHFRRHRFYSQQLAVVSHSAHACGLDLDHDLDLAPAGVCDR